MARDWPQEIFGKLREAEIRQIVYVPDSGHARLIEGARARHGGRSRTMAVSGI